MINWVFQKASGRHVIILIKLLTKFSFLARNLVKQTGNKIEKIKYNMN